jgi:hypothetical protein
MTGSPLVEAGESEFPLLQKPLASRGLHAAIQRHLRPEGGNVVSLFPQRPARRRQDVRRPSER